MNVGTVYGDTVFPNPNRPSPLKPHAYTVPSDFLSSECRYVPTTCVIPDKDDISVGTILCVVSFSPSWPYELLPQE